MFFATSHWYNVKQIRTILSVLLGLGSWAKVRARPLNLLLPVSVAHCGVTTV